MESYYCFDDVLIVPKFSTIKSRQDVNPNTFLCGRKFLPVISANMDSVTEVNMAKAMAESNAVGCLHRFWTIEKNCIAYMQSPKTTWVSIGLGGVELTRAQALYDLGAETFVLDVAHGASEEVVKQVRELRKLTGYNAQIVVGNFATAKSIQDFMYHAQVCVDAYKVGIGGGAGCLTRVVTGCGMPTFASVVDCVKTGQPIIADGGIRNSGDLCKALGAGAAAVMCGNLLAGTLESPGEEFATDIPGYHRSKRYRGSASSESYKVQGKEAQWRSPEGASFFVPYKGSVKKVLQELEAGLRSAMSYVNASNIFEFKENVEFIRVTSSGAKESQAHGQK